MGCGARKNSIHSRGGKPPRRTSGKASLLCTSSASARFPIKRKEEKGGGETFSLYAEKKVRAEYGSVSHDHSSTIFERKGERKRKISSGKVGFVKVSECKGGIPLWGRKKRKERVIRVSWRGGMPLVESGTGAKGQTTAGGGEGGRDIF